MTMLLMRKRGLSKYYHHPLLMLRNKRFTEEEERGGHMILCNATRTITKMEIERYRCENLIAYVLTLHSYLSDVTNNTPGPVYPWSFALRPG